VSDTEVNEIRCIEGDVEIRDATFAVVAARFNEFIVEQLIKGALDALDEHGASADDVTLVRVPGAWELPLAVRELAESDDFDAIIALGAVIRGDTPHFEYVAGECSRGLADVQQSTGVPVVFGVLTTDTIEQAVERANTRQANKGAEVALAAIEMVNLLGEIGRR
jgi:6,7-dimethyl-8-ribityllumazine synthase